MFSTRLLQSLRKIKHELKIYNSSWSWIQPKGKETGIKVYNSITRTQVPLILTKNNLFWYMCGPTVYSHSHIGHAFCYVKFDILRRIMENIFQINVVQVMGITDIDDKIINRANETNIGFRELALKYETEFTRDMLNLNVLPPTATVRVSDSIIHIVKFIEKLLEKRQAYVSEDGSVYFDVTSYGDKYGKLAPAPVGLFEVETQDNQKTAKKNEADFALWKAFKEGEPWWSSPWGKGRPGWHIECSAIASNIFGDNLDLHSGGIDLLFPHHENELAQSEAYHSVSQWVNYWLHSGHLHYKQEKMSKSLENTISIQEFLTSHSANVFRIFCLLSHYRNKLDYRENSMEVAASTWKTVESFLESVNAYVNGNLQGGDINESEIIDRLESCKNAVKDCLANDFNTHDGLINILNLISYTNKLIQRRNETSNARNPAVIAAVGNYVTNILKHLGIVTSEVTGVTREEATFQNAIQNVVTFRNDVRQTVLKGDGKLSQPEKIALLKACDQLRNSLLDSGIKIKDHGVESSWSFVNK